MQLCTGITQTTAALTRLADHPGDSSTD